MRDDIREDDLDVSERLIRPAECHHGVGHVLTVQPDRLQHPACRSARQPQPSRTEHWTDMEREVVVDIRRCGAASGKIRIGRDGGELEPAPIRRCCASAGFGVAGKNVVAYPGRSSVPTWPTDAATT